MAEAGAAIREQAISANSYIKSFRKEWRMGVLTESQSREGVLTEATVPIENFSKFIGRMYNMLEDHPCDNLPGGNLSDYVKYPPWYETETLVLGQPLAAVPGDRGHPAIAAVTQANIDAFNLKVRKHRKLIFKIVEANCTEHWHKTCVSHQIDKSFENVDGQEILKSWHGQFQSDQPGHADDLRKEIANDKYNIIGAENPRVKLDILISKHMEIQSTPDGTKRYDVYWFAQQVTDKIDSNELYLPLLHQEAAKMKAMTSTPQVAQVVNDFWKNNRERWEKMYSSGGKKVYSSRKVEISDFEDDMDIDGCSNCKSKYSKFNDKWKYHSFANCRMKGGGSEEWCRKCYNAGKPDWLHYGHGKTIPCKFSGGKGSGKGGKGSGKGSYKGGKGGKGGFKKFTKYKDSPPCTYPHCKGNRNTHPTSKCNDKRKAQSGAGGSSGVTKKQFSALSTKLEKVMKIVEKKKKKKLALSNSSGSDSDS